MFYCIGNGKRILATAVLFIATSIIIGLADCRADYGAQTILVDRNGDEVPKNGFSLTLIADSTEALLNGTSVSLQSPPIIRDNGFFIPLQEITELLGGTYDNQGDQATIRLWNDTMQYQIGSRIFSVNGRAYTADCTRPVFPCNKTLKATGTKYVTIDEQYTPVLVDGTVYLPWRFSSTESPLYDAGINSGNAYPDIDAVIMGGFGVQEYGIGVASLRDEYDGLPNAFTSQLESQGFIDTETAPNYAIEKYSNAAVQIYVMRVIDDLEDIEVMDGKICAIHVTGEPYQTPRGLRIGDAPARVELLYGTAAPDSLAYCVENGRIKTISFYTNYYGSTLSHLT